MRMAVIRRLMLTAICAVAIAVSGVSAPPPAAALVPCGSIQADAMPAADPSHPGQFSPQRGPCDDSLPARPALQPPALILPA